MFALTVILSCIGVLAMAMVVYAACVVSGEIAEQERERYREQTGREPEW